MQSTHLPVTCLSYPGDMALTGDIKVLAPSKIRIQTQAEGTISRIINENKNSLFFAINTFFLIF